MTAATDWTAPYLHAALEQRAEWITVQIMGLLSPADVLAVPRKDQAAIDALGIEVRKQNERPVWPEVEAQTIQVMQHGQEVVRRRFSIRISDDATAAPPSGETDA